MAVLRGDPDAVADALEFEHKYTSGVIAWAPEDRPSDQDIDRVLDKFEQTAWAGLAPDRYAWAAVRPGDGQEPQHRAPPGWQQTYDPLVEALNLDHGWSRPDDPARAREQQPGIRDYLLQRVEHGTVQDRAGVVAALHEAGFDVPRQGDHYVTMRDPATEKRWRLKGTLYEHDFQRERLDRQNPAPDGDRGPGDERAHRARATDVWRDVARTRASQAAYRRDRYGDRDIRRGS